jgi:Tfp pilus assembly protein PilX
MTTRLLVRLRAADGIALPVAMLLMMIMIGIALGMATYIDNQSAQTGKERKREVTFNLAEAALNAQVYQLSQHWPGPGAATNVTQQYGTCTPAGVVGAGGNWCPPASALSNLIPSVETTNGVTWQTNVYDDSGGLETFFADSRINGQPGYDANNDGKVWVRAQATVGGKTRAIVSLVRTQTQSEAVPHAALIANSLTITNNGNHSSSIIAPGADTSQGAVDVRCNLTNNGQTCLGQPWNANQTYDDWYQLVSTQINPPSWNPGSTIPTFTQDEVNRFIATAQAFGTYYTSCPSTLSGNVVVIAGDVGNCQYQSNAVYNSQIQPGFLIILNSGTTLTLNGGITYYGVIYYANQPSSSGATQNSGVGVSVHGNATVVGGILIDGAASLEAGSSGNNHNLVFDDHGFDAVQSLSSTNIIPNSWREIQPGQ